MPDAIDNLEDRIALARRNIADLTEQGAGVSGAALEKRVAARLAEQQERLNDLLRQQEALKRKGPAQKNLHRMKNSSDMLKIWCVAEVASGTGVCLSSLSLARRGVQTR
ncbi:hypothetical protein [Bosea sp. 124]|uniref:hypothetical protein n=1 Tax=Bosea sp. 124 TaxID=2135642 RepID=UPI000D333F6F|nr:hypothetical protein [Bosea sp. 124]